jgi:predicted RNase H-like HicB family nuclease
LDNPKYEIVIYWSKQDNCYLAEVPELPGCMADGMTIEEVTQNIKTIMSEWIVCAIEDGEAIPEPKGKLMYA